MTLLPPSALLIGTGKLVETHRVPNNNNNNNTTIYKALLHVDKVTTA